MRSLKAHIAPLSSVGHATCWPMLLALLSAGAIATAVLPVQAASIVPSEAYCLHGCDLPEIEQLDPGREIPLSTEDNPLKLIAPLQDYIGEIEDGFPRIDSDSEWRTPSGGTEQRLQN